MRMRSLLVSAVLALHLAAGAGRGHPALRSVHRTDPCQGRQGDPRFGNAPFLCQFHRHGGGRTAAGLSVRLLARRRGRPQGQTHDGERGFAQGHRGGLQTSGKDLFRNGSGGGGGEDLAVTLLDFAIPGWSIPGGVSLDKPDIPPSIRPSRRRSRRRAGRAGLAAFQNNRLLSSRKVTGPSLTLVTCMWAERPLLDRDIGRGNQLGDLRTVALQDPARLGCVEPRPAALATIAVQRELTDQQDPPPMSITLRFILPACRRRCGGWPVSQP